jgi:DNA-binding SARP family transcriptional activator
MPLRYGRRTEQGGPAAGDGSLLVDIFERFPYGILVVDRAGRIITSNGALDELAAIPQTGAAPTTCCELLGCGDEKTGLGDVCVTQLAISSRERLPDLFVQPPRPHASSLWVTAAPLYEDGSKVIFQIRPVAPEDRKPETPAGWLDRPRLWIYSLGPTRLATNSGPLHADWLGQRAGQLLKYLVSHRNHVVPTEKIAEAIWPNASFGTSNTVRHTVHVLREKLGGDHGRKGGSPFIVARQGGYALDLENVTVDADVFERAVSEGLSAFVDGNAATATERFEQAVGTYRGDYLIDEPYAEWAFVERERLRDMVSVPLRALIELRSDEPELATLYAERLAELEPFDNEVQRQLIELYVSQSKLSKAVRQYHALQLRLLREFNASPTFRLEELVHGRT